MAEPTAIILHVKVDEHQHARYELDAPNGGKSRAEVLGEGRLTWPAQAANHKHILSELRSPNGTPALTELVALGQDLYHALFPPDSEMARRLQAYLSSGRPVRLSLEMPQFDMLPWEAMHDERQFLVAQPGLSLARSLGKAFEAPMSPIFGTLNVLFVAASPTELPALSIKEVADSLVDLLAEHRSRRWRIYRGVRLTVLLNATRADLLNALNEYSFLRQPKYHVVCIAAHGDTGMIFLNNGSERREAHQDKYGNVWLTRDPGSHADHLHAEDFATMLADRKVRLVFLMACKSADAGASSADEENRSEKLAGLAQTLAATAEIPAVVAMQTEISAGPAAQFTVEFFRELAAQRPVDVAMSNARVTLLNRGAARRDTIAPVLYLQTRTANLFRAGVNWLLVIQVMAILLLLGGIAFGIRERVNFVNAQIQERNRQIDLRQQSEQGLQRLAKLFRAGKLPTGDQPEIPLLAANGLWVSNQGGNTVQHYYADGTLKDTIPVGNGPRRPVYDQRYLWVSNTLDSTVTRIDPANPKQIRSIPVGLTPERPLVLGDGVWVQSLLDWNITYIPSESAIPQPIPTDINAAPAFTGGGSLWVITGNTSTITRIDGKTRQPTKLQMDSQIDGGLWAADALWLMTRSTSSPDTNVLQKIDPVQGTVVKSLPLSQKTILDRFEDGVLWAFETDGTHILEIDPTTVTVVQQYDIQVQPRRLFLTPGRLWVSTDHDTIIGFDRQTAARIGMVNVAGAGEIAYAANDSRYLWFAAPSETENVVYLLDLSKATLAEPLQICSRPRGPVFDGTNMWFSCVGDRTLVYLPANMYFLGTRRFRANAYAQTPLIVNGKIWVGQEGSGQVLIYDPAYDGYGYSTPQGGPVTAVDLNGEMLPLTLDPDGTSVWTATTTQHTVYHLTPRLVQPSPFDPITLPRLEVDVQSMSVEQAILSIHIWGDYVWVLQSDADKLNDLPDLVVLRRTTLERAASHKIGAVPTGLERIGNDVWMGASDSSNGKLVRFDVATPAAQPQSYTLPDTNFAAWPPVALNGMVWFVTGAPSLNDVLNFVWETFVTDNGKSSFKGLYGFDPASGTFPKIYLTYPAPTRPLVDAPYLWMLSSKTPVLSQKVDPTTLSGAFAIDTRDGRMIGPFKPCAHPAGPSAVGKFVWIGCYSKEGAMWVINRDQMIPAWKYDYVGSFPSDPVLENGHVWFTFRDSNSAAVFDAQTGELLQIFATGKNPTTPILFQNQVWTYNAGDGSWQRLTLNQSKNQGQIP